MIRLGFEVGSGDAVDMPLHHLIICGMTGLSGKTTSLEALVHRSGLKAITFRTKRGEIGFEEAHKLPLYFDERGLTNWQALEGLMEATLGEKISRDPGVRAAIIRVCSNATGLEQIYERVKKELKGAKGFLEGVFTKLLAYLDIVMPQIKVIAFTQVIELRKGANMMDLEGLTDEMQNLVLHSVIQKIYEAGRDTIIVLPEAWKFVPQDRGSPCKVVVEKFIREGAAIGNYLWIDSQDLRGVDKKFLRQIDNWIMGRQRDPHEVEAMLDVLPIHKDLKPKPHDIQTLDLGHFYACLHNTVSKVYVQPKWLDGELARKIAMGEKKLEDIVPVIVSVPEDWSNVMERLDALESKL